MARYEAVVRWRCTGPEIFRGKYSRAHTWEFDGGLKIPASASPHVVPAPWSDPAGVDPEEAFIASVSSCHMLTYLWLASKAGFAVESYEDLAFGEMTPNASRVPWVSRIVLRPLIVYSGDKRPSPEEETNLHHAAHAQCFIAASIKTEVTVESRPQA
jgi:organic hydroperoxide reductase OsmC/OhrA